MSEVLTPTPTPTFFGVDISTPTPTPTLTPDISVSVASLAHTLSSSDYLQLQEENLDKIALPDPIFRIEAGLHPICMSLNEEAINHIRFANSVHPDSEIYLRVRAL